MAKRLESLWPSYGADEFDFLIQDDGHEPPKYIKGLMYTGRPDPMAEENARPLAVMVPAANARVGHGVLGKIAAALPERGFDVLALDFYYGTPDDPEFYKSDEVTYETYLQAIERAVDSMRAKRGAGFVVGLGHSLGALALLESKAELMGAVLLEPAHGLVRQERGNCSYEYAAIIEKTGKRVMLETCWTGGIWSDAMIKARLTPVDTSSLADQDYPVCIVNAEDSALAKYGAKYEAAVDDEARCCRYELPNANHYFNTPSDAVNLPNQVGGLAADFLAGWHRQYEAGLPTSNYPMYQKSRFTTLDGRVMRVEG